MQDSEVVVLEVDETAVNQRLDSWVSSKLEKLTRSKLQKYITQGLVTLNGEKCQGKVKLKSGDVVRMEAVAVERSNLEPKPLDLDILFEDEHIVVVNKTSGVVVHPGAGDTGTTLVEGLLHHFGKMGKNNDKDGWMRPGIVHRLDKDTSGVIVCAKTDAALANLSKQFADKTNTREYYALLNCQYSARKKPEGSNVEFLHIDSEKIERESYLYRDPNSRLKFCSMEVDDFKEKYPDEERRPTKYRWAKSSFYPKVQFGSRILLAGIRLHTGRTHQIRIHSQDLKASVLGDPLYGSQIQLPLEYGSQLMDLVKKLKRQMLHAKLLGFKHPETGEQMVFEADFPNDYQQLLELLQPFEMNP